MRWNDWSQSSELRTVAFQARQIANNGGASRANLRTAVSPWVPEILSLGPFVSKPPHFADLVRFS
jgi:hypothetical protein